MEKIRVLLIENETLTRLGIKTVFADGGGEIEIVGEAETGVAGLDLFKKRRPDVLILSLRLPDSCAIDTIQNFLAAAPKSKIIILAAHAGDGEISRALERGASGYILKDVSAAELVQAVRTVHAGKKFIPAKIANVLSENLGSENLTPAERKILAQIVAGQSNKEIAADFEITENTVKTHVKNILAKLGVDDRTAAATTAIRRGLVRLD